MKRVFLAVSVVTCSPAVLIAAEEVAATASGDTMSTVAKIAALALEILQPLLVMLVSLAVYKLAKKFGVQASDTQMEHVKKLANEAVDYVQRWAKNKAKAGEEVDDQSKLAKAVDFINKALAEAGLKKQASEYLVGLVESQLEKKKNNGTA